MVILNLSTTTKGGSGLFSTYFNHLLCINGHNSYLIVKDAHFARNGNTHIFVYPHKKIECFCGKYKRSIIRRNFNDSNFVNKYIFYNKFEQTTCYSGNSILQSVPEKPDVIFIHWVSGFVNFKTIKELKNKTNAQIIILMIDNSPLTGGCHYPWECKGYEFECENCPAIIDANKKKLAHNIFMFKNKYIEGNEKVIAFSNNDFNRLNNSTLFKNNPKYSLIMSVDEKRFKPITDALNLSELKSKFNISTDKTIILIAATYLDEERKGMKLLLSALKEISRNDFFLVIAGNNTLNFDNYNHKILGYLNDSDLISAFQIADVFACPTIEDSGPIMINQSIMTGTPVVAFKTGVAENLVIENQTGYLAEKGNFIEFANGLKKIISHTSIERKKMKQNCRDFALKTYSEDVFFNKIEQIISNNSN